MHDSDPVVAKKRWLPFFLLPSRRSCPRYSAIDTISKFRKEHVPFWRGRRAGPTAGLRASLEAWKSGRPVAARGRTARTKDVIMIGPTDIYHCNYYYCYLLLMIVYVGIVRASLLINIVRFDLGSVLCSMRKYDQTTSWVIDDANRTAVLPRNGARNMTISYRNCQSNCQSVGQKKKRRQQQQHSIRRRNDSSNCDDSQKLSTKKKGNNFDENLPHTGPKRYCNKICVSDLLAPLNMLIDDMVSWFTCSNKYILGETYRKYIVWQLLALRKIPSTY